MSIKKQFLKSKPVCKVTFALDADGINGAEKVAILGDFNNWNPSTHEMKKCNGSKRAEKRGRHPEVRLPPA